MQKGIVMDKGYERYCLADRLFYEIPRTAESKDFEISCRELPEGWRRAAGEEWLIYRSPSDRVPAQGWKIHVTGSLDTATQVLETTWDYCVPRDISFKHLRNLDILFLRNAKYASRGGSGKLVTIYPEDEAEFERIITELGALLRGLPGPYILSDLRIGEGPLHVRYGGFAERRCVDERGELVLAIEDDTGRLVPDRRDPVFSVPTWITPPRCLEPHLAARRKATTHELPYRIDKALHFSNGGGVYQATDLRDGRQVVLKEARPHAGLSADRADAVARLRHEHTMLTRLAGVDGVPEAIDHLTLDGHHFLVQEFIDGRPLNTFFARRHPLIDPDVDPARIREYTDWALKIHAGVADLMKTIHERGVVFNDLHPFNVMVRPDDTVALIDFEVAALVTENRRQTLADPAFVAPADRRGIEVDDYGLACLLLSLFMPLTKLFLLDRGKARFLADVIAEHFPVPPDLLDAAVREITRGVEVRATPAVSAERADWPQTRAALTLAILASATPERDDRLFPGDIRQFSGEGMGLAHGAAGVLYALHATGAGRYPDHEEWLAAHACDPPPGIHLGLYDGLMGSAYVLAEFGHTAAALKTADHCLSEQWERLGTDLSGGLAGWALALDRIARLTGESTLQDAADRAADLVIERFTGTPDNPRPGLMYGASGLALMMLRRYESTGDERMLTLAATALRRDLAACVADDNGALQVDEGYRILPYLWKGSAGIGMVIEEYLALCPESSAHEELPAAREELSTALAAIRIAAKSHFYIFPNLMDGRAGMALFLSRDPDGLDRVREHIRALSWHVLPYEGGLAFPGQYLHRLSMDLHTGTAGVLLALGAALHNRPVNLPFFTVASRLPAETSPGQTPDQPERG